MIMMRTPCTRLGFDMQEGYISFFEAFFVSKTDIKKSVIVI